MLCETCRWNERPGFVRVRRTIEGHDYDLIPCPDCGGHGIAHCCDGICEQPEARAAARPQALGSRLAESVRAKLSGRT